MANAVSQERHTRRAHDAVMPPHPDFGTCGIVKVMIDTITKDTLESRDTGAE